MCLIAHRENTTSHIPAAVVEYNRQINPDGFGLAWRDGDALRYEKFGPKDFPAFSALLDHIDGLPVEYVAHFRKATHGPACEELAHPFTYEDKKDGEVLVFHNGIISIKTPPKMSDTQVFVSTVLSRMAPRWWHNDAYKFLVEGSVGWSRLLIMTPNETVILNESDWKDVDGIMYSTSPLPVRTTTSPKVMGSTWSKPLSGLSGERTSEPSGKSASESASVLLPAVASTYVGAGSEYRNDSDEDAWVHAGHWVHALDSAPLEGDDHYGDVVCDSCKTIGYYYTIDGKRIVDLGHLPGHSEDEDEEEGI